MGADPPLRLMAAAGEASGEVSDEHRVSELPEIRDTGLNRSKSLEFINFDLEDHGSTNIFFAAP